MSKGKPLIPLWALVLGPLWIPILVAMMLVASVVAVVFVLPTMVACQVFGWRMPDGVGLPEWFSDEYEMMP